MNDYFADSFTYGLSAMFGDDKVLPTRVTVCGEEYIPRATYLAAEKEIEKLHELNWKLEKALMEEREYVLSADGERWIRFINSYVLNHSVILESIPVGEVIG